MRSPTHPSMAVLATAPSPLMVLLILLLMKEELVQTPSRLVVLSITPPFTAITHLQLRVALIRFLLLDRHLPHSFMPTLVMIPFTLLAT